jgi:3-oxoacyl-[acyl-carrier-protein] synthase-1
MKNLKSKRASVYLPALGMVCSLGVGKQSIAQSLFGHRKRLQDTQEVLLSGKSTIVRPVSIELPALPSDLSFLNSRNNCLLRLALDEIAEAVKIVKKIYGASRVGIVLATSTSGMLEGERGFSERKHKGKWPDDYHYVQQETASPSVFASLYLGITGPSYTISTACSSGSKALCSARRLIHADICDAVISGGVDTLCNLTLNGFDSLELLSEKICNPFSKNRSGITLGEGAAVFLVTRESQQEKFPIEFAGCGESSDAYHISAPDPTGDGAERAMREALDMASMGIGDIAYINLHGTATLLNDAMESQCIHRMFGETVPCSSTKALTGHTLGAAGALEAGFLWLSLSSEQYGSIPLPSHIWDGEWDPLLPPLWLSKSGERAFAKKGYYSLMSNSFAFGGSNSSLILSKKCFGKKT